MVLIDFSGNFAQFTIFFSAFIYFKIINKNAVLCTNIHQYYYIKNIIKYILILLNRY